MTNSDFNHLTDFTKMMPEEFDRLTNEELAQACTRGSGHPKSEAWALIALRKRFALGIHDHNDACAALWRDRKTAAEILDAVRDMAAEVRRVLGDKGVSIAFDPSAQYGDFTEVTELIDDALLGEAKERLAPKMEALIPQEYRHKVEWVVIQPVLRETDILTDRGFVAWKYTPTQKARQDLRLGDDDWWTLTCAVANMRSADRDERTIEARWHLAEKLARIADKVKP